MGTIEALDGSHGRVTAQGETYEEAKAALDAQVLEGHKLIVIRTL
jgi:predicted RNase H-like HicB family nuclease